MSASTGRDATELITGIQKALKRATGASLQSLEISKEAGDLLIELKSLVPHGEFTRVGDTELGLKKSRRAELMELSRSWEDFEAAKLSLENKGKTLLASDYTARTAIQLARAWKSEQSGEPVPVRKPRALSKPQTTDATIHSELEAAKQRQEELENENNDLRRRLKAAELEAKRSAREVEELRARLKIAQRTISRPAEAQLRTTVASNPTDTALPLLINAVQNSGRTELSNFDAARLGIPPHSVPQITIGHPTSEGRKYGRKPAPIKKPLKSHITEKGRVRRPYSPRPPSSEAPD